MAVAKSKASLEFVVQYMTCFCLLCYAMPPCMILSSQYMRESVSFDVAEEDYEQICVFSLHDGSWTIKACMYRPNEIILIRFWLISPLITNVYEE